MKVSNILDFLMVSGRWFYRVDAAFLKRLLRYVMPDVFGTLMSDSHSDLMLFDMQQDLYMTGSQWDELTTGVIWSCLQVRVTSRTAEFCVVVHVSLVCLADHTGEHCRNPAMILSGHVPVLCKHLSWYTTWYDQYYELSKNNLLVLHLLNYSCLETYQIYLKFYIDCAKQTVFSATQRWISSVTSPLDVMFIKYQ